MSERSQQMLCKGLEMAEKAIEFYEESIKSCGDTLGKELFEELKQDKVEHMNRIKDIHDKLVAGKTWIDACLLPEEEDQDLHAQFAKMAEKYDQDSCPASDKAALERALHMEKGTLVFWEYTVNKAEDDVERKFLQHMVREVRGHNVKLADAMYYYEDPEAWMRDLEKGNLDG